MNSPKISIIIPVYNKAEYIKRCLSSILGQSFKDFELIIINDGSTDQSSQIIRQIAETDSRIHYFEYCNSGVSIARNRGLDKAVGEYVLFIDSDDYIEQSYLSNIFIKVQSNPADCYIWGITKEYANGKKVLKMPQLFGLYDRKSFLTNFIKEQYNTQKGLYGYVSNKLLSRSLIESHHLRFRTDMRLMEDYDYYLSYFSYIETVYCFAEHGYHYVAGTYHPHQDKFNGVDYMSLIDVQLKCRNLLQSNDVFDEYNAQCLSFHIGNLVLASFLEMSPVTKNNIRNLLHNVDVQNLSGDVRNVITNKHLLKILILHRLSLSIAIYVTFWNFYLKIRHIL